MFARFCFGFRQRKQHCESAPRRYRVKQPRFYDAISTASSYFQHGGRKRSSDVMVTPHAETGNAEMDPFAQRTILFCERQITKRSVTSPFNYALEILLAYLIEFKQFRPRLFGIGTARRQRRRLEEKFRGYGGRTVLWP